MGESVTLDELDRSIVAALQLNGRASWKQIADAIGSTHSTVARRGQHLLESRVVSVTGVLDHLRCGLGVSLQTRLRCRPGRAAAVAAALAELPSTCFVSIITGSADVAAEFVLPSHRDVTRVLVENLPRSQDVIDIESFMVTRKFSVLEEWDPGMLGPSAVSALRSSSATARVRHPDWHKPEHLNEQELRIAAVVAADGRASYKQIANELGMSESTAARRVESMVRRGCLLFRTLFEPPVVGLDVEFLQWISVEPSELEATGAQLAKESSTRYVCATTGRFNLYLQGVLPGYGDLYDYTVNVTGALSGIRSVESTLQVQTLKRAWVRISPDRTLRGRDA